MTHEILHILKAYQVFKKQGVSCVLASLVDLNGSSYRKPGVRMLIAENGETVGAVSGGCVEKEIALQAQNVFRTGQALSIQYDGRFRLGCEGILHLLIEPMEIETTDIEKLVSAVRSRKPIEISTFYELNLGNNKEAGSFIDLDHEVINLKLGHIPKGSFVFQQRLDPIFELFIFGAEHDSAILTNMASKLGWQVTVIVPADEQKTIDYFDGAYVLKALLMDEVSSLDIGTHAAVLLMTHSISKDVQYLTQLTAFRPMYFGLLGPAHRRERLIEQLLEFRPETEDAFIEGLSGPAGLDIGAQSASEIALSILSEILAVIRNKDGRPLRLKNGAIHA